MVLDNLVIQLFIAGLVSICLSILIGGLKDHLAYIFTDDE